MNFLLAKEDAEKHTGTKSCYYCSKVFSNYRALGGHLRIHQEDKALRSLNYPGCSSNSMDAARNPPAPTPNGPPNSSGGGNNPPPLTRPYAPLDFSRMFFPNEASQANRMKFTSNPGVAETQFFMPPDFSYGFGSGATYHHDNLASRAIALAGADPAMSSAAFAPSGGIILTDFPIDSSLYLGSGEICQFNTDEFLLSQDGLPPPLGDVLQNIQGNNLGPHSSSDLEENGQYDNISLLVSEDGKRPTVADGSGDADMINTSKKTKVAPTEHEEPENPTEKELALFMNADDPDAASETCAAAEEEGPGEVDTSLHL